MPLSLHVLDTANGRPAEGIEVSVRGGDGRELARAVTDRDGRIAPPFGGALAAGVYELRFFVKPYFERHRIESFFDEIPVRFTMDDPSRNYHVPLLLSPWGYSTYRGS